MVGNDVCVMREADDTRAMREADDMRVVSEENEGSCPFGQSDWREENAALTAEYLDYVNELQGDELGRRAAWKRMGEGTAYYRGEPAALSYLPRVFGSAMRCFVEKKALVAYGILTKVIERYRTDAAYRREFRFDPRVEELVLLPTGYDELLPVARVDFALNEESGELRFVEFNTDSSSGMDETRNALAAVEMTEPYQRFTKAHQASTDVEAQFAGWVRTFKRIYESSEQGCARRAAGAQRAMSEGAQDAGAASAQDAVVVGEAAQDAGAASVDERPRVAIVACLDSPNPHIGELETFMHTFEDEGFACSVFDVRQLRFDGEKLVGEKALAGESNVEIDCIWRFCIVVDLLEHWGEMQDFIEAVRSGKVPMIGGFSTQIVHDKQLFAILRKPATLAFLTQEEREFVERHIPRTVFLDELSAQERAELKAHPERWVIKPTDWYASINVSAGAECDPEEWARLVDEMPAGFIAQEFFAPHKTDVVPLYGREEDFACEPRKFGNLFGAYVYAGKFAGLYVRQGPHDVIGSAREGLVAPVLWVSD